MSPDDLKTGPGDVMEAMAFETANSCAYLSAVFQAYRDGYVVLARPASAGPVDLPGIKVVGTQTFEDAPGWFEERFDPIFTDAPAQVAFSSGTTGTPKALLLPHRALSDVVARINAAMEIDSSIREYVGVPVTFSFGFGRCRAVAAVGGKSYLPPNGFDPLEIAAMLEAGEINAISAVPTLWRVVLANPDVIGLLGAGVKWIEIGSQYMAAEEKEALKRLFPNARIVQHYGLTEASRSTLLDISRTEGPALESVGRAEGDVELAISAEGEIRVRGPHVAAGLLTETGLEPIVDAEGWLTTSDRGRLEDGWLYYEGRTDELINCGGIKIDPTRFEQRLTSALQAPDQVAVGRVPDAMRGDRVLVVYRSGQDVQAVREAALGIAETYGLAGAGGLSFREVAEIPRTKTGKIQRRLLADLPDLAQASTGPVGSETALSEPQSDAEARAADLQKLWAEVLNQPVVSIHESFYDLGGDSLSALTLILRMERLGLDPDVARGIFDGKTIADLVGLPPRAQTGGADGTTTEPAAPGPLALAGAMNAVHAARGVLVIWVILIHWLPGLMTRMAPATLWLYEAMMPLIRFGTPGFALVFGLGIGALRLPQFLQSPEAYRRSARFSTILVTGGVLVLGLFKLGLLWSEGNLDHPNLPSATLYSAISYYMLALIFMPLILRLISLGSNRLLTILGLAVLSMLIHEILAGTIAQARPDGVLELIKILLTAKYGFFRMTAYVLVGAAIGHMFRTYHDAPHVMRTLSLSGLALILFGFIVIHDVQPEAMLEGFGAVKPWHLMIYAGLLMLILAGFCWLNRVAAPRRGLAHLFNAAAIATGILALPLFVGHEIIIPFKNLLSNLGVSEAAALGGPLLIFVAGFAMAYRRLLRFLLGGRGSETP